MVLQISKRVTARFRVNSIEFHVLQGAYMQSWIQTIKKVIYGCHYSGESVSELHKHNTMNEYVRKCGGVDPHALAHGTTGR
jgi:hypothetical protein